MSNRKPASNRQVVKASFNELKASGRLVRSASWLPFGPDDLKPQLLIAAGRDSGTLALCINTKAKFIEGNGFKDSTFYQAKVNKKQKVDALHREVSKDLSQFEGFALHVNYNAFLKVAFCQHVPFEKCRQERPDENDQVHHIYVVNRLDKLEQQFGLGRPETEVFPVFNPDPAVVQSQIEEAGGLLHYKGQILYYFHEKAGARWYPAPLYETVWEDIVTEIALKRSRQRDVKRGFSAKVLITKYGTESPTDEVKKQDAADYGEFAGEDGSSIMLEYAKNRESKADIDAIQAPDASIRYKTDEEATKRNIKEIFQIPDVLYGSAVPGSLGLNKMVEDAIDYVVEHVVNTDQRAIEENFKAVFSNWATPVCPSGDFSIQNKKAGAAPGAAESTGEGDSTEAPVDIFAAGQATLRSSVGGGQIIINLQTSVAEGKTQYNAAVKTLHYLFGYDETIAKEVLGTPVVPSAAPPAQPAA